MQRSKGCNWSEKLKVTDAKGRSSDYELKDYIQVKNNYPWNLREKKLEMGEEEEEDDDKDNDWLQFHAITFSIEYQYYLLNKNNTVSLSSSKAGCK